jgi:Fe2+ transport system protein FeoA
VYKYKLKKGIINNKKIRCKKNALLSYALLSYHIHNTSFEIGKKTNQKIKAKRKQLI